MRLRTNRCHTDSALFDIHALAVAASLILAAVAPARAGTGGEPALIAQAGPSAPAPPEIEDDATGEPGPAARAPATTTVPPAPASAVTRDYYVKPRGYRIIPDGPLPRYVRDAASTGIPVLDTAPWLDVGLDFRMRFEYRENSFLRTPQAGLDEPVLLRTRLFVGIKKLADPLRFAVELQDSRVENTIYPPTNREVNEYEPIQLYGELYFDDGFGTGSPIWARGGRMAFELVDRRLIAANEFRNTTNTFQGLRVHRGRETDEWDLDLLALQPLDRLLYQYDQPFDGLWLYGGAASWRRWSAIATIQPYWFGLTQQKTDEKPHGDFSIQTTGVRAYGIVGRTGWDWDADVVYQWGDWVNGQRQNAGAFALELGYTVEGWSWLPRASAFFGYGTGDRDPNDNQNNSFNSLYGFNQPWSRNDYFSWDNAIMPKARLQITGVKDLLVDLGYGAFWLASATAAWQRAQLRDPTGQSGNFLGNEYDVRIRYWLFGRLQLECSYSYFDPGGFPTRLGKPLASNFFYVQLIAAALT